MTRTNQFNFVDLFCGVGGFHAALEAMGGTCVLASDIDKYAKEVYELNWGVAPVGDIAEFSTSERVSAPPVNVNIDVLAAGFPCQPFSKSGKQKGMTEKRGTLFDHIMFIIEKRHPKLVILENVRNLSGPRHRHEFDYVIKSLRDAGYVVSSEPSVFSPHKIAPEFGGRPQIRERLFITATYSPRNSTNSAEKLTLPSEVLIDDIHSWDLDDFLENDPRSITSSHRLTEDEFVWLNAWEEFQKGIRARSNNLLPGHPLWSDEWVPKSDRSRKASLRGVPDWKQKFLTCNWDFYDEHSKFIDRWKTKFNVSSFPATRRKFEWQAQNEESIWNCAIHLRPSGVRVKRLTYLPAFVAMNQTSIIGPLRRRITTREAARLQGLPEFFEFGSQPEGQTYKQLGNGVNVGVIWQVLKAHAERDSLILQKSASTLLKAVRDSPKSPDQSHLFEKLRNVS